MKELRNLIETNEIIAGLDEKISEKSEEKIYSRKQFTFYRSYYDSICRLPKMKQLMMFHAICGYAMDGIEPELDGAVESLFILIKPTLESSRRLSEAGAKGGSVSPANGNPARAKEAAIAALSRL